MMLSFLFLTAVFAFVSADIDCQGNRDFSPPVGAASPIYFPPTWTPNQPPPVFGILQSCQFTLKIPQGMYAEVRIHKVASQSEVTCTYPNLAVENVADMDTNPYIFTSPQAVLSFKANGASGSFAFELNWKSYTGYITNKALLGQNQDPFIFQATEFLNIFTAAQNSRVSLVAFNLNDNTLLRQSVILDGDNLNALFIGTLSQVLNSGRQLVSTSNTMTVYTFGMKDQTYPSYVMMGSDYHDTAHFARYTGHNCKSNIDCSFLLSADIEPAAVVTAHSGREYIKNLTIDAATTMSVYKNGVRKENLVDSFNNINSANRLPSELSFTVHQYTIESGRAFVQLSRDETDAKWTVPYDGRTGVMQSYFYGKVAYEQDTDEYLTMPDKSQKMYFEFSNIVCPFDGNGIIKLYIAILNDGKETYWDTFSSNHQLPTDPIKVLGDTFKVKFSTNGTLSSGFKLDFKTTSSGLPPVTGMSSSPTTPSTMSTPITAATKNTPITTISGGTTKSVETTTKVGSMSNYNFLIMGIIVKLFI